MKNWAFVSLLGTAVLAGCSSTPKLLTSMGGAETPFSKVLKMHPEFKKELASVEIRQYLNQVESPTSGEVRVIKRDLLDDSIKAIRIIYQFRLVNNQWIMTNKTEEHQCARGNTQHFQSARCP